MLHLQYGEDGPREFSQCWPGGGVALYVRMVAGGVFFLVFFFLLEEGKRNRLQHSWNAGLSGRACAVTREKKEGRIETRYRLGFNPRQGSRNEGLSDDDGGIFPLLNIEIQ